jgi:hypothetical protein
MSLRIGWNAVVTVFEIVFKLLSIAFMLVCSVWFDAVIEAIKAASAVDMYAVSELL